MGPQFYIDYINDIGILSGIFFIGFFVVVLFNDGHRILYRDHILGITTSLHGVQLPQNSNQKLKLQKQASAGNNVRPTKRAISGMTFTPWQKNHLNTDSLSFMREGLQNKISLQGRVLRIKSQDFGPAGPHLAKGLHVAVSTSWW